MRRGHHHADDKSSHGIGSLVAFPVRFVSHVLRLYMGVVDQLTDAYAWAHERSKEEIAAAATRAK